MEPPKRHRTPVPRTVAAASGLEMTVQESGERAQRFGFQLPLQYRTVGESRWRQARMENISRSGVLFRTSSLLDVDTEVEIVFVLPVKPIPPSIVCRGRVVRTVPVIGANGSPALAATITAYRFVPGKRPPA